MFADYCYENSTKQDHSIGSISQKQQTNAVRKQHYKLRIQQFIHRCDNNYFQMNKQNRKKIFFTSQKPDKNKRYQFKLAWGSAPHPHKAWKGGEDALYVSKNILIVADGVGGWIKMGIDSGVYARELISIVKQLIENEKEKELYFIEKPQELAIQAVQKNNQKGSATLSIVTLHPFTGVIRSYHIGDSIFGLFKKNGEIILAQEQQKSFNVPFQVFNNKNNPKQDSDQDQEQTISDVLKGSYNQFNYSEVGECLIVLASDGLWDNIHMDELKTEILSIGGDLVQKTKNMIRKAKQYYQLEEYASPFYQKALKQGEEVPKCGKVDDISVIIAEIVQSQSTFQ